MKDQERANRSKSYTVEPQNDLYVNPIIKSNR
jgi:hypothetical protein